MYTHTHINVLPIHLESRNRIELPHILSISAVFHEIHLDVLCRESFNLKSHNCGPYVCHKN